MATGFVAIGGRMNWVDKMGVWDARVFKGESLITLMDTSSKVPHFRSWRCKQCGWVLMDYGRGFLYTPWFWEKDQSPVVVRRSQA